MSLEQRNLLMYLFLALAAFAVGCATALVPQLMDPTMPPMNWRIVIGTGITALITAYGGSRLPRTGSTTIAAQVDNLKSVGVPRRDMIVVTRDDAAATAAEALTPTQVQQVADELERRMRDAPAEET
jgi:hypothetical protein